MSVSMCYNSVVCVELNNSLLFTSHSIICIVLDVVLFVSILWTSGSNNHSIYSMYSVSFFFVFKKKTAYEMLISDWSSDVCSSDLLQLYEIKSDLEPRTVIREALGQILEYAFHPRRQHVLPLRLIIVGRCELRAEDGAYLDRLRANFGLPIEYRSVSI